MRDQEEAIAAVAVVLFDGEQEINVGVVVLFPSLNFKNFQLIISERIGLSPHQFTTYISDRTRRGFRIPVTAKTNFPAISRNQGFFFLVVLKRSRRERRRKISVEAHSETKVSRRERTRRNRFDPPRNVMLLRRDGNAVSVGGYGFQSGLDMYRAGYERYFMDMGLVSSLGLDSLSLDSDEGTPPSGRWNGGGVVCVECSSGGGNGSEFHWCVYDPVTVGFRSRAGPIARPAK